MSNYIISNLRKPSDYSKAVMTQDQLLNIAIRNDANIAKARNDIKLGMPPIALTPQQEKSPEELEADISKQYSDAITNLQNIGFSYKTSGDIAAQLQPDQLFSFNQAYPSIDKDIKTRYNPKLITPTFFTEYLNQYLQELAMSKGLSSSNNLSYITGKFNGLIDSVNELKSIIPSQSLVRELRKKFAPVIARLHPNDQQVYYDEFDALEAALPSDTLYKELEELQTDDPVAYQQYIQRIQTGLQDAPTTDTFQRILRQSRISQDDLDIIVDNITRSQEQSLQNIYDELAALSGSPSQGTQGIPLYVFPAASGSYGINTPSGLGDIFYDANDDGNWLVQTTPQLEALYALIDPSPFKNAISNVSGKKLKLSALRDYIRTHSTSGAVSAAAIAKLGKPAGSPRSTTSSASSSPRSGTQPTGSVFGTASSVAGTSGSSSVAGTKGKGLNLSFGSTLPIATTIDGLKKIPRMLKGKNDMGSSTAMPQPLRGIGIRTKKIGSGIKLNDEPIYKEFGKYCIHMPQLLNKDVLNVKYKSLGGIPDFKPMAVSENYKDFILDLVNNNKLNNALYKQLPLQEKKHFEKVSTGAGVFKQLGLSRVSADDDKKDMERFELVRGEVEAGNDNPKLIKELKHFIIKFLSEGKITKQTAFNLLLELSV
jgi:hypothetical protein